MNHLEDLIAEWYVYQQFFVKRNIRLETRNNGGYVGEIDLLVLDLDQNLVKHIEISSDSRSKARRNEMFNRKFEVAVPTINQILNQLEPEFTIQREVALLRPGDAEYDLDNCVGH